jgi:hypothetical protein
MIKNIIAALGIVLATALPASALTWDELGLNVGTYYDGVFNDVVVSNTNYATGVIGLWKIDVIQPNSVEVVAEYAMPNLLPQVSTTIFHFVPGTMIVSLTLERYALVTD